MRRHVLCVAILGLMFGPAPAAQGPRFEARFILPPQEEHVHSSSIVELPNGDLFAVYYRGSGERRADDVRLERARLPRGAGAWSAPFPVADSPGFPDCNPVAFVDARGRLLVVWPAVLDNRWESALLRYRAAPVAGWTAGPPPWNDGGVVLLRPDNLKERAARQRARRSKRSTTTRTSVVKSVYLSRQRTSTCPTARLIWTVATA